MVGKDTLKRTFIFALGALTGIMISRLFSGKFSLTLYDIVFVLFISIIGVSIGTLLKIMYNKLVNK